MNNERRVILWFRNDLRLHDNEALHEAIAGADVLIPVFVFDERTFGGRSSFGFEKTGPLRAKFIIESIEALRIKLCANGSNLIVHIGKPEEVIFELAKEHKTTWVFCNRERTDEEVRVQDRLEKELWSIGQEIRYSRGKMLYYTADLPFPITHAPEAFIQFRKEVEKMIPIRSPLPIPTEFPKFPSDIEVEGVPSLLDLGYKSSAIKNRATLTYQKGGEDIGLARLKYFLWESDAVSSIKKTEECFTRMDQSSNLSAYLAQGCISPKMIFQELQQYEKERVKNKSTHQLYVELLWRDFFRLIGKKHGNDIFKRHGIKLRVKQDLEDDLERFLFWSEGRTGIPLVDAAMNQLNSTGYLSHRLRQIVASFLVNDLKINWQLGAEYFESLLLDYDPCSNWCNWNYIAGVGNDPREDRYLNPIKQAMRFDPDGIFVKKWLPQLKRLDANFVHQPYKLSIAEQSKYGLHLGKDYPLPCVSIE